VADQLEVPGLNTASIPGGVLVLHMGVGLHEGMASQTFPWLSKAVPHGSDPAGIGKSLLVRVAACCLAKVGCTESKIRVTLVKTTASATRYNRTFLFHVMIKNPSYSRISTIITRTDGLNNAWSI
jgi:hypothetical protein